MTAGIPPQELDDEDLLREMDYVHKTRDDTVRTGSQHALAAHTDRMIALEQEFLRRFPEGTPDPLRTRAGRRAPRLTPPEQPAQ
jgi:hypothetical protein